MTIADLPFVLQIGNMNGDGGSDSGSGGPMWGKFFDSIGGAADDDNASALSGSHATNDQRPHTPSTPSRPTHKHNNSSFASSPQFEVLPGDSASAVGVDDSSEVGAKGRAASSTAPAEVVDDGTYIFKFKTPSGRTHRFQARHDLLENLREIVTGKLETDPFFTESTTETPLDPAGFTLSYTDDDGDLIHMTSDGDVTDAVKVARAQKTDRVVLFLSGGKSWDEAIKAQEPVPVPAAPSQLFSPPAGQSSRSLAALQEEEPEAAPVPPAPAPIAVPQAVEEKMTSASVDPATEPAMAPPAKVHSHSAPVGGAAAAGDGSIAGIPKDLILPASIGFLGVAVLAVFALSRASK